MDTNLDTNLSEMQWEEVRLPETMQNTKRPIDGGYKGIREVERRPESAKWRPQRESNPYFSLRRTALYPFNYRAVSGANCRAFWKNEGAVADCAR